MELLAQALNFIMEPCYQLTGNWWLTILLFTVIIKIILLPLSLWCQKNSIVMVQLMPDLNRVKIKFYGDREAIGDKQSEIYKKHHYHPMLSLVPLAIQILILFGLVDVIHGITDFGAPGTELLGMVPFTDGGISWLMPLFAGISAIIMGFAQNRINPLQKEQGRAEKNATNGLSIGLSFVLGIFVATGMGFYWVCSNIMSIAIQALCNLIISPKKHIDYADLDASRAELADLEALDGNDRKWYQRNPLAKREKTDYKRFFKTINKHIVFFSESSGFYRYFQGIIEWLLAHSDVIIHYVTNDPHDQIFDLAEKQPRIRPYYIGPKRIITLMMKMDAHMVVATLEDLDAYYIKRSYVRDDIEYVFLFHHMTSTHMTPRKGAFDGYDTILCVGEHQIDELRRAEELYKTPAKNLVSYGYDLLDRTTEAYHALADKRTKKDERPTVLIGPSWQEDCILDTCIDEIIDNLRGHGYRIIVRPHPEYTKRYAPRWEALIARHADVSEDELYFERDFSSNETVFTSDILITDWSSVAHEFSFATNKPSIFIDTPMKVANPDYEEIGIVPTDISLRDEIGVAFPLNELDGLAGTVEEMLTHQEKWRNKIEGVAERTVFNRGHSAEVAGEYLLSSILDRQRGNTQGPRCEPNTQSTSPQADKKAPSSAARKAVKAVASHAPEALIATLIAFPFMAQPAYAYVDPSVMTYTIQALAGVAVALSAVLGVVFRKTRRKLFAMLNIDENARKEVEGDVHRVVDGNPVFEAAFAEQSAQLSSSSAHTSPQGKHSSVSAAGKAPKENIRWLARLAYSLLASVFLSFTLFVVAPFEIVASNASSIIFGLEDVGWYMVAFAAVVAIALALVLSIFRGRVFSIALLSVIAIGIGCYVQALLMNSGLPAADGATIRWSTFYPIAAISAAVWLFLLALAVIAGHRSSKRWRVIGSAIAIALITVQGVGIASIIATPPSNLDTYYQDTKVTEDGLFNLSSKDNVVVFVLDMFDTADMVQILKDHPEAAAPFTNFTFFKNISGSMMPTRYGVPFLLTGDLPQPDQTFEQWREGRYDRSNFLGDISNEGYSIGLYSDTLGLTYELPSEQKIANQTLNVHPPTKTELNISGTIKVLVKTALYRDAPWLIKPWFWYYTDEINDSMVLKSSEDESSVLYQIKDPAYYQKLKSTGLELVEDDTEGAFRFIHMLGAHYPYTMDENGNEVGEMNTSHQQQARGSLMIVDTYLDEMRRLGIYDSSTIIITSDHGYWNLTPDEIIQPSSPLTLVKPSTDASQGQQPMAISDMPVAHGDLLPTIIEAIGGDSTKYGPTVFDIHDPNRKRYFYNTTSDGKHDTGIREIEITGQVLEMPSWHKSGKIWPIAPPEN